jgi:predicted enzyme related to lactoylglutathione lyase
MDRTPLALVQMDKTATGRFCWVDLAATDADSAKEFYAHLLGWKSVVQPANGGSFTRLRLSGSDVGSMYQLQRAHLDQGMLSHWTPYIQVDNADDAARRATALGGNVIVRPFDVSGVARIALILDSVGAQVGLWQPIATNLETKAHG